jgi:hypothetical protein
MSFADSEVLPFTNAHQPSLATTAARHAAAAKKKAALAASKVVASRLTSSMAHTITKLKNRPELDNMHNPVPFSAAGNGLLGFGLLGNGGSDGCGDFV